ncbi:PRC-barrel domain protein [Methanosalsum zhilinae DSM 4017]|uniref:PRC-barrel domain protein n=1 Tax=Methanosalsum zhilinae (strain DSM 4017 / NBRC 107636 / OCM 62 / WeN5) TaxID=679901 RepID=F7XPV0_METZD|nr:PRC-barrel domain-containing protein [Methanosalsum zhilinae]AEH61471.1 PRC-barrel domain protein [Methanosalsum zhilinae DSM 4017]
MTKPEMLSAESIKKDPIKDSSGKEIGKFIDFMVDMEKNTIPYVIVSLNIREGYVGVPWEIFKKGDGHYFLPDVDNSKLMDAPGFPENEWPDVTIRDFEERVNEHFGTRAFGRKMT